MTSNTTVVGAGFVGLPHAATLAQQCLPGEVVTCVDKDAGRIATLNEGGKPPIFEPGLQALITKGLAAGTLRFTTDLAGACRDSNLIFLCVGTPPGPAGEVDLTQLFAAAEEVAAAITGPVTVIIKSTVPAGTNALLSAKLAAASRHPITVVSNPEFLREGSALTDLAHPDRVVIGSPTPEAAEPLAEWYRRWVAPESILVTAPTSAELIKQLSNTYLAMKISFADAAAALSSAFGADVTEVLRGVGLDRRIGPDFLRAGIGFGGFCFPKDVAGVVAMAEAQGLSLPLLGSILPSNRQTTARFTDGVCAHFSRSGGLKGKRLAAWGAAFKANTDDIRESPAIRIIQDLVREGAQIRLHDPKALDHARKVLGNHAVTYAASRFDACDGADGLLILTEWEEYQGASPPMLARYLKPPGVVFDGRNLLTPKAFKGSSISYYSVGRPVVN